MNLRGAVLWGSLAASAAQERPVVELEKLLKMPVSPGVAALLVPHASDVRALEKLREGVKSPRAETRASAARAAHVAHAKALLPDLQRVLVAETNAEAAREQIRALASLAGSASEPMLREAARRFTGRLDADLLETLARTRGPDAIPIISSEEWRATVSPKLRGDLLLIAARGDSPALVASFEALLTGKDGAEAWKALLQMRPMRTADLPIRLMLLGLHSADQEIAGLTAWELAKRNAATGGAEAELSGHEWKAPAGADTETIFAFELLARSVGERPRSHPAWIQSLKTRERSLADDLEPGSHLLRLLEPPEREAVKKRWERLESSLKKLKPSDWEPSPRQARLQDSPVLRSVSDLPRGVVADTLAVCGCKPKKRDAFGAAQVQYNVEGRPLRVTKIETDANLQCESAATALFLMTLVPSAHLKAGVRPQILLAFGDPECMHGLEEPDVGDRPEAERPAGARRVGQDVRPPKLVGKVEPRYPMRSRQERREGSVILEAIITTDGCVSQVETIQGVDPILDYSAARAVSQWRYRPATVDGEPVRVYLTVTVTFNLR